MAEKLVYAKEKKCSDCGKQAEVWFPCCDPDIPCYPYCKPCANKRQMHLMMELAKIDHKRESL